ncbi:adenylate/guanylate cyclase domain-containing protein [Halodesulfovibrio aestuarii]|uniref:adenylate/guanylate cyclase domain-containing protein n=1 Tax=Halodesulfovibrio aestuarii TaxID=126333 RepID=UPI00040BC410
MSLEDFKKTRLAAVKQMNAASMDINISITDTVPRLGSGSVTYPSIAKKEQKCLEIETCVLYVDMRKSTEISDSHHRDTLAKLYSSFIESMVRCAEKYSGHVRGIVGDRVMVVFDKENCFKNAVDTAVLMNSVCKYVINKEFTKNTILAGIGIDYGTLLVAKTGVTKNGDENVHHKSLVWLGRPANVASKLTDEANKPIYSQVQRGLPKVEKYTPEILMTKPVHDGICKQDPNRDSVKEGLWKKQELSVTGYDGDIYGGNISFITFWD